MNSLSDVHKIFEKDGLLAKTLPYYEYRQGQIDMSKAVAEAFRHQQHLIVEAGTGVGRAGTVLIPFRNLAVNRFVRIHSGGRRSYHAHASRFRFGTLPGASWRLSGRSLRVQLGNGGVHREVGGRAPGGRPRDA